MPVHTIYIDIETIPAGPPIDPATMPHPSKMSAEKTIEAWRKEKAPLEAELLYRKRALKSMEGEIFCICWAVEDGEVNDIHRWGGPTERHLLDGFVSELKEDIDLREAVTWVGHNILTFDMAWLWRRAVRYDMRQLARMIRLDRYKNNIHDTMLMWRGADYQDYTSLDDLARWLGVGEPVGSGSEVYDWYLAGEFNKIVEHCKTDLELTRNIYKKIRGY